MNNPNLWEEMLICHYYGVYQKIVSTIESIFNPLLSAEKAVSYILYICKGVEGRHGEGLDG